MAGLAAGLAVTLPGSAAAQPAPSSGSTVGWPKTTSFIGQHRGSSASDSGSLALIYEGALAAVKTGLGEAQERVAELAVAQLEARRLAVALAAARRARAAHAAQATRAAASPQPASQATASGSPQQIAQTMLASYGWSASQFSCLQPLWAQESGWNVYASNPSSGAYGIPQALPGSKMASAGPNWQIDAATQIRWGLGYIQSTYGSPCGAWAHEQSYGWY